MWGVGGPPSQEPPRGHPPLGLSCAPSTPIAAVGPGWSRPPRPRPLCCQSTPESMPENRVPAGHASTSITMVSGSTPSYSIASAAPAVCIAAITASRSGMSISTATLVGLDGSTNVRMLVTPRGPKNSSRLGEAEPVVRVGDVMMGNYGGHRWLPQVEWTPCERRREPMVRRSPRTLRIRPTVSRRPKHLWFPCPKGVCDRFEGRFEHGGGTPPGRERDEVDAAAGWDQVDDHDVSAGVVELQEVS